MTTNEERFEQIKTLYSSVYNYAQALQLLQELAGEGYAPAQHELGDLYYNGTGGLNKNDAKALEWYRKAAEQGDKQAAIQANVLSYKMNAASNDPCEPCHTGEKMRELGCAGCPHRKEKNTEREARDMAEAKQEKEFI